MRFLLAALLLLAPSAFAQSRISLLITVTNTAETSNTIVINGTTRTWTNASTATTILTNLTSANGTKSNLFSQFSRWWTFAGPLNLVDVGTNSFKVVGTLGGSLSASISGTYAILTLSTQSGTATYTALYPLENMSSMTDRVNEASSLVYGLGTYSTNAFATNSAAISNTLVKGASPLQRVLSPVLFDSVGGTNSGLTNGNITYANVNFASNISGRVTALTNGYFTNAVMDKPATTNLINYGAIQGFAAGGGQSFGTNITNSAGGLGAGKNVTVGESSTDIGFGIYDGGETNIAIGTRITIDSAVSNSMAIGNRLVISNSTGAAIGNDLNVTNADVMIFGHSLTSFEDDQMLIGGLSSVRIAGRLIVADGITNLSVLAGTNVLRGDLSMPWASISTLADGNNVSVPFGTNVMIRLSGTLTSTGTICGAIGGATTGGRDGQLQLIWNDTGQIVEFTENTSDPIPANRFALYLGATVTLPDDSFAWISYSSAAARWKVVGQYPGSTNAITGGGGGSSTNGILNIATNNVKISGVATQANFVAGNNFQILATNDSDKVSLGLMVKSNLSFYGTGSETVLGTWGTLAGFSNATLGVMSLWVDDPSSDTEWTVGGNVIVGGIVQATNVTLTAIPGTGTNLGVTAGGTLFRTTVGGSGGDSTNVHVDNVVVLAADGNDSTAIRENIVRPYLTASNATAAILDGDTLLVRGGTYLINPKAASATSFSDGQNESGGLAITNRSNISIIGQAGAIWQMSGFYSNSSTYSQPMLNLTRCTNVVIDGLTMRGIKTNAQVLQDYAVLLTDCDNVTFRNCRIQNWNNQGITDLSQTAINRNLFCYDCEFRDTGGTNCITLGNDGTAWSAIATNIIMSNNKFYYNLRNFEECCNGDARGLIYEGNYSIGCYGSEILMIATNNSEMKFVNNISIGYATNEQAGGVSWLTIRAASNVVVQGNQVQGFGGKAVTYDTLSGARFVDVQFLDNTFHDFADIPFFLYCAIGNWATFERISIMRNKFRNMSSVAIAMNANDSRIEDNEFAYCNTALHAEGIVMVGYPVPLVSTNATNITIIGNKLSAGQSSLVSTAIVIYAQCYSNSVWGNDISRIYQGQVHDLGSEVLKAPVNLISQGELLMNDTNRRMAGVIIGSGLTFDPATRTLTGTSGSSSQYVAFAIGGLTLTNNVDLAVSNTVNFGSRLKPAGTNYVMGLQLPTGAGRNRNGKSDDNGFLSWGTPNSGGNGNGSGVFAPVGGIQFAMTNATDNTMMLESTNDFRYLQAVNEMQITNQVSTSNTVIGAGYIKARLLEVSNLNVSSLVVTNGIPAAGGSGRVQFSQDGILAGTNDLVFQRTNLTLSLFNGVNEAGVRLHQNGIYQTGADKTFNFGLSDNTNMWSVNVDAATRGSLQPYASNMVSIGTPTLPLSNVLAQQVFYAMPTVTVLGANSNQTVRAGTVNTVNMLISTNITFTNHSVPPPGFSGTYLVRAKVTNSASNVGINFGVGSTYDGVTLFTNANNAIWGTLTNTMTYLFSWTYFGNNAHLRVSQEQ